MYAAAAGITLLTLFALPVSAQDSGATSLTGLTNRGALVMDVQATAVEAALRAAVSLQPNGQPSVSGVADVIGFPFIESGTIGDIDWKVDGSQVAGSLTGKDGKTLGTFEGTTTPTGLSGKFTHVDGRVGLWSWNGPAPAVPHANGE